MKFRIKIVKNSIGTFYEPQVKILFFWRTIYLQGKLFPSHGGDKKRTEDLKQAESAIQEYKEVHEVSSISFKYF